MTESTKDRRIKHGMYLTKTYRAWNAMKQRCMFPRNPSYEAYGGRGIKVCEKWLDFRGFLEDMGQAPIGMTLERRDVDGMYEKINCLWAPNEIQQNNKRNSRKIEHMGMSLTIAQWERHFGYKRGFILIRLRRGWPIEKVFEPPRVYASAK